MRQLNVLFAVLLFWLNLAKTESLKYDRFIKLHKVGGETIGTNGKVLLQTLTRSRLACARQCLENDTCFSYTYEDNDCCLFDGTFTTSAVVMTTRMPQTTPNSLQTTGSPPTETGKAYFNRVFCENGGTRNKTINKCACVNSYVGEHCERLMKDCSDGYLEGQYHGQDGVFTVKPDAAPNPFEVRCIMKIHGRLVFQRQKDGNVSFNRTWSEYKEGFGDVRGDHWLGNDKIYYLTNNSQMIMAAEMNITNRTKAVYYKDFQIKSEELDYQLEFAEAITMSNSTQYAGDCLEPFIGSSFTTSDKPELSPDCPQRFNGWWRHNCSSSCNLNGAIRTNKNSSGHLINHNATNSYEAIWNATGVAGYALFRTQMQLYTVNTNENIFLFNQGNSRK
ncbi:hypothetical protein SNE40_006294 [Patella caerulea]|uniref:Fibrinogen C-terminal domain-containing protein n=1 Tax=Patella caerulea TaxID=87958 RepID=A0AAN8K146_PATCE